VQCRANRRSSFDAGNADENLAIADERSKGLRRDDGSPFDPLAKPSRVALDEDGGPLSEGGEGAAQSLSGVAVTPQDVLVVTAEHLVREVMGAAGHESVESVGGVGAREALGTIAPVQEALRHNRKRRAPREEAKEEVPILGPAVVVVTHAGEELPANRERRMSDRALDERVETDRLRRGETIEPRLVRAPAVGESTPRKEPDVRADGIGLFERSKLHGEPLPLHEVVGVHPNDDVAAAGIEPALEGGDEPRMVGREHPKARVPLSERGGDRAGLVVGAVLDDEAFERGEGLPRDTTQAPLEGRRRIERR